MKEFEVTYWFRDPQYGIQVSSEIFEAEDEDEGNIQLGSRMWI